ncbi:MAG: thiolase family protein [Deltaproteobacteria bacterium]|nr:MAG: thiolase family protein [Deltaproteobacteria bacterium]
MSGKNPRDVVVVAAVRTPVTKAKKGALKDTRPDDLLTVALKGALERVPDLPVDQIGDIVIGTAMPEGEQGMNVARIAGLAAGVPESVPAMTINRFCSSGLQSLAQAAACIQSGWYDIALTGGVESMTQIPMGGDRPSPNPKLMAERPEIYTPMGTTSENVARRFGITRQMQDEFALRSHQKAAAAIAAGRFQDEIVPVPTRVFQDGRWQDVTVEIDDGVRPDTTLEALARLRPAFAVDGTSTAGNSSQVSDGAAATLIMAREKAEELGLPVLGVLRSYQVVGVPPEIMGIGPKEAIPKAVEAAGLSLSDIGLFEINEAFASQAVYCVNELGIDLEIVNVNGGAIALGHPLGCTGAKLTATLLHEMKRRGTRFGVVSMCIGGGMGAAAVFENEAAS